MTVDDALASDGLAGLIDAAVRLARAIDATCSEKSVRHFLIEIADASKALDGIDVSGAPSVQPFTATWPDGIDPC